MSFLVGDDDQAVLKEALAFIDACGTSEGTADSSGSDSGGSLRRGTTVNRDTAETPADSKQQHLQTQPQNKAKTETKKRRIKTFASSSTCQLQRKKAEALSLREQLLELEAHVALLKRTKYASLELSARSASKTNATTTAPVSVVQTELYERALTEFVRRQRSEKTNRTLKAILANQQQVCGSLRSVLQKRSVLHGLDVVFENPPSAHHPLAALDHSVAIIGQLEKRVENLYIDADSVFQSDAPPLVTANMQVKHSTQHGKVVEIETVTPVACSIQEASAILWKDLKTTHKIPDKRYRYLRGSKPYSLEKNFMMRFRGKPNDMEINGSHFSQKFEEADRIVLAKADLMILPTEGLHFRTPSWTIITRSESDPLHASVVRSYMRIYAETQPDFSTRAEDFTYARDFVLTGLSKMMYDCAQRTQSELVQHTFRV